MVIAIQQANISAASRQQKSVIASSTQESAPSVLDGNPSTAWKANKGEYITFALENNASPNNIAIAWKEKSKDAKFEIQLSGGGGQFLTVYEGTVEATNELTNYRFKGTTASDIRIVITSGNASIRRFSSLPHVAFTEKLGVYSWELVVAIPFQLMGLDPDNLPEKIMGNFYKCATTESWSRSHEKRNICQEHSGK